MFRIKLYILVSLFILGAFASVSTNEAIRLTPTKYSYDLDYAETNQKVSVILLDPIGGEIQTGQLRKFNDSLFNQLYYSLEALGNHVVRYSTYAEVALEDKKDNQMVILPTLDYNILFNINSTRVDALGGFIEVNGEKVVAGYKLAGTQQHKGRLNLLMAEPGNGDGLGMLTYDFNGAKLPYQGAKLYKTHDALPEWDDQHFANPAIEALNSAFYKASSWMETELTPYNLRKYLKRKNRVAAQTFKFDYEPPKEQASAHGQTSMIMLNPTYRINFEQAGKSLFNELNENMALDFQELITARGFVLKGPFENYDEIVFMDKKGSDLMIEPILDLSIDMSGVVSESSKSINIYGEEQVAYRHEGEVVVEAYVNISIYEPLSRSKLWAKKIALSPKTVHCLSTDAGKSISNGFGLLKDTGFGNPIGEELEAFYNNIMQTAWNSLHPEEMKILKAQSAGIKKNFRHTNH